MDHTEIMHYIAQAAINITEGVPGPIERGSPIHKALIALCEEESRKEHVLVLRVFGSNGSTPERETETGPFTSHAEAERTLRGAMTTGRFVSGTIVTREKKSKIAGTFHPDVAIDALKALISTVEQTGGLLHGENIGDEPGENEDAPAADPDWIDLATAYLLACEALGREPVYSDKEVRS